MKKSYLKLTEEQKKRGVIFSSSLSYSRHHDGEIIHEVFKDDDDQRKTIDRLLDDKFFNGSNWKYNVIRQ